MSRPRRRPATPGEVETRVLTVEEGEAAAAADRLACEEPLEIRLRAGGEEATVAVTMRTPGADLELALGFLFAEGIVRRREEVAGAAHLEDPWAPPGRAPNVLAVELAIPALPDLGRLERHFFTSSACGVCGKAGIETLRLRGARGPKPGPAVEPRLLYRLPQALRAAQGVFAATGGLHAAAAFSTEGRLLALREDVGRHNAVDKLLGWALGEGRLPLSEAIVLVSGRSSFEIVQKCLAAEVPIVASVSAPSSLAVDLAREFGMTLVGFLRGRRCNVYAGEERVALSITTNPAAEEPQGGAPARE